MFRTALISFFITSTALATTWTVDDDGKADFDNIQAAIDVASDGDERIEGRVANISINDLIELPNGHYVFQFAHEGRTIATTLERFYVTTEETTFVLGNINQKDIPFVFDPSEVTLLRSVLHEQKQTHAVIAIYKEHVRGSIKLQSGKTILLANTAQTNAPASRSPEIPLCSMEQEKKISTPKFLGSVNTPPNQFYRLKQAVETDYEYRTLFDSTEDAAAYVVLCFGLIHDVYLRDTNTHIELTYVRLWEDENDLFNQESPLGAFRNYWNENMQLVDRNLAQFFSGRRNLPYGGSAYISAINEDWGYSVVGYLMGFAGDINRPDVLNYDVHVAAHEIGHNCGTYHTHDYGIDDCFNLDSPPVRGPIMSYCSQTTSGGNAVTDVRFHTFVQDVMDEHMQYAHQTYPADFVHDCNGNGIDDETDISSGTSTDWNGNGMPDECEDCNQNGTLDSIDIQLGSSQDVDGNGVPDECENDCNENNVPDAYDIAQGTSFDIWGNGIPDECESDCDGNGQSDYNQIQEQMNLDLDRDLILDSCQDCNADGVTDLDELNGAWSTWVGSNDASGEIVEFHSIVGTRTNQTPGSTGLQTWEILITDDYRILATSPTQNSVLEYDRDGNFIGELVPTGSNGLLNPTGMVLTPTNTLLVSSNGTNQILEFDAINGDFIGVFAEDPALTILPLAIVITEDQRVLVSLGNETVSSFDLATGNSNGLFVISMDNGGLVNPRGMAQLQNGDVVIASMGTNNVLKFDGETGNYVGQFNNGGTDVALTMDEPWGVRVGPDGDVYVTRHGTYEDGGHDDLRDDDTEELHVNSTRMYIFDGINGNFLRSYITGNDTELWQPTGFDFMPGTIEDCNINGKHDACDILSGTSEDVNGDGIPDECGACETDINGDGYVNVSDLLVVIDQWGLTNSPADVNQDGIVNVSDLLLVVGNWGPCE